VTRSSGFSWVSLRADLDQIGNVIFRLASGYETPWPVALFVIAAVIGLAAWILERQVRGVEVVA
jgi:hypothetical protein